MYDVLYVCFALYIVCWVLVEHDRNNPLGFIVCFLIPNNCSYCCTEY